jgi:hypothetical protein
MVIEPVFWYFCDGFVIYGSGISQVRVTETFGI